MTLGLGAGLAVGAAPATAQAATFKWASDGDVGAMDPYTRQETVQLAFLLNIYEPLVRRDAHLKLEPALAVSWKQISPTVWRFHLRPNVKWQDGSPFTADDVVFSLHRTLAKTSSMRASMSMVKDVRKVNDLTVDFETFAPDPIFPQEQTNFMIMSKAWCEAHGSVDPVFIGGTADNYAVHNAMGTGPYRLVSREPDRKTVVEKNPTWWDKNTSNADRVELDVIHNDATRVAALLSGEEDMIYSVPLQDMKRIAATPGLKLIESPELRTIYLGMDVSRPQLLSSNIKGKNPFQDIRVRKAFELAIDENAIAARVMQGLAHPTALMWGPGVNGYDPKIDVRPKTNVAEAKKLMAEAGYPKGFEVGMDCPNDRYVNDAQICTAVASMLARINVKIDLNAQTKAKFFAKILAPKYDTDFYLLGWTPSTYDAHNVLYTLLGTRNGKRGEVNVGGYSNPKLDDLITKISEDTNEADRNKLIDEAGIMVRDDVATIPLHQQVIVWGVKKDVSVVQTGDNDFTYRFIHMGAK
ncbi:MAG: ABC transporter substrate-binding protein [Rhodospirillales bacterium]|nr:ABC transporter substrate-binding protein [Rhodospirillales bacterium]